MKAVIVVCSLFLLAAGIGCAAFSEYVTLAKIDKNAVQYVVSANVADPNKYKGYPNLKKVKELHSDVDLAYSIIQFNLQKQIQTGNLEYSIHRGTVSADAAQAQINEEKLFGETGLLSLGFSVMGFGTLTGMIGLLRKRPGDVTKTEMEQAVATVTGKSAEELSTKEKQFIELVKGVQIFMDENKGKLPEAIKSIKEIFDKTQDTETQLAVAKAKQTLC